MLAVDYMMPWLREHQAMLRRQITLMESGKFRMGEDDGSGRKDITAETLQSNRTILAELNRIEGEWKALKQAENPSTQRKT